MDNLILIITDTSGCHEVFNVQECRITQDESENYGLSNNDVEWQPCLSKFKPQAQVKKKNGHYIIILNSYLLRLFLRELDISTFYRRSILQRFCRLQQLYIVEVMPEKCLVDYVWNIKLEMLAKEKQELENTMSWLSTLGGAFSALGDEFSRCAKVAGRISVAQFRLATRLGDPGTQARCRLYLALSLLQQGRLRVAKRIIRQEFCTANQVTGEMRDTRLIRMCQGIWAKLKYTYSQRAARKSSAS